MPEIQPFICLVHQNIAAYLKKRNVLFTFSCMHASTRPTDTEYLISVAGTWRASEEGGGDEASNAHRCWDIPGFLNSQCFGLQHKSPRKPQNVFKQGRV